MPEQLEKSNRRFFSREHSSSTWMKSQGLVTWEKQELSYKGQHPTNKLEPLAVIIIQCIPEVSASFRCNAGGGERKSPDETYEEQYLGIPCIWYLDQVPRLQPWIPLSFLNVLSLLALVSLGKSVSPG